ncbi:Hypothetical predicted protein [Cloeon dipterum]|uniref:Peptidase S1 domain-containing protein n=1 Tax=Cloeon dipterum TaxID=197152 RepID=A0A8S1DBT7_9INSE|nr:Hypothetical predicted protein [Cloeon dipterum]
MHSSCYPTIYIALFLLLTGLVHTNVGNNEISAERVVGGTPVTKGKYPSQVCIKNYSSPVCAATIISKKYILTAAHCYARTQYPEYLGVTAGSINIYEGDFHSIMGIIIHDDFDSQTGENDIAIMEVHPPFVFGPNIRAAPLPAFGAKDPAVGTVATIIGWGETKSGGPMSYLLLEAQIEIRNHTMCREVYAAVKNVIFPSQICANDAVGGKGTCNGDSGGPLFIDGVLVGVASHIQDCDVIRYPSVFARVSYYRDWIRTYTGSVEEGVRIIVGGHAFEGEYPSMIGIVYDKTIFICGGTIISERHVLTSAYCVKEKPDNYAIYAGSLKACSGDRHDVLKRNNTDPSKNNIAILELVNPFNVWSKLSQPAVLPRGKNDVPAVASETALTGWGKLKIITVNLFD